MNKKRVSERLCFSTLGCPDWDFEKIASSRALKFSAVELRGVGGKLRLDEIECLLPENRGHTRAALEAGGLALACVGTSIALHRDEDLSEGFYATRLCAEMGIPNLRVFGDAFPDGEPRERVLDRVAGRLSALLDAADGHGASVLLETHGQFNNAETLGELIARVGGHPRFGLVWDIEHTYRAHGHSIEAVFELIRPYVRHAHIKDATRGADGNTLGALPGEGEIDILKHIRLLEQSGYDGYYSFEWEKRWNRALAEPEEAFPAYVRSMRQIDEKLSEE